MAEALAGSWPDMADTVEREAAARGATSTELFGEWSSTVSVRRRSRAPDWQRVAVSRGVGVRVFIGPRQGYAYSTDISPEGLRAAVDMAVSAARVNQPSGEYPLPTAVDEFDPGALYDERVADPAAGEGLEARLAALEGLVDERSEGGLTAQRSQGGEFSGLRLIANSGGLRSQYRSSSAFAWVEVVRARAQESGHGFCCARAAPGLALGPAADEGVWRAQALAGAGRQAAAVAPLVLSPPAAASLVGQVAPAVSAEAVRKGHSFLQDALDEEIASKAFRLRDLPTEAAGLSARPWDDEGVSSAPATLVEDGRLRQWLHSCETAAAFGVAPTSHARRSSYRSTPEVASTNLVVDPGGLDEAALLEQAAPCLYVVDWLGSRPSAANASSGRYSAAINGRWYGREGWGSAVRGATVAGSVVDLLKRVSDVGRDPVQSPGAVTVITPALLIDDVQIGGTDAS